MRFLRCLSLVVATASLSSALRAQQFQQVTLFPDGAGNYSEGVVCADVDKDGDLDIIVADGSGASSGTSLQNRIYVNKLIETSVAYSFVDESVARFGANLSNAKGVTAGDVNGDGWVDVMFANSNTQAPSLYINQGAGNPGFFTLESATRGFTTGYKAGSAQFADFDDDGDLDVVINDAFNTSPAARVHLYVNNGAGFFTENTTTFVPPLRSAQMSVHCADMDNDFDVDVLGFTKMSTPNGSHLLMLNNGAGSFSDSSSLIGPASGATYEADVADLDGDNDLDMFFVSLSGFAEGAVRNNLVPNGTLTFTTLSAFGGDDDNEIAYVDYDNDGDYDVMVGSLGGSEKIYRNDGNFTFVLTSVIQAQADSTLDCTFGDLNNDGTYEAITVQGESGSFRNKFYKNTGSPDTLAPVLVAEQVPATAPVGSPVVVHAKIRDQVLDDGVNYVTSSGDYVILTAPSVAAVSIDPGTFNPATLNVTAGTTVTWTNNSGGSQSVKSTTTPYTYDSGTFGSGGTYTRTFVKPGSYTYTSVPGGFSATVVVGGSSNAAISTPMGGQEYRFRMNDTSGGLGILLCYELRLRDWPGNVLVTPSHRVTLTGPPTGSAFCFGDGTGPFCPCGNLGNTGRGCANSQNSNGALLVANGTTSPDTVVFSSSGELPTVTTIFLQGDLSVAGVPFGDGLRCAGGTLKRLYVKTASGGTAIGPDFGAGDPNVTTRSAALGDTIPPGGTRYYQAYYRDADPVFCAAPTGNTYNISNGSILTW